MSDTGETPGAQLDWQSTDTGRPTEFSDLPPEIQRRIFQPLLSNLERQVLQGGEARVRMRDQLRDAEMDAMISEHNLAMVGTEEEQDQTTDRLETALDDIDRLTRAIQSNDRRTLQRTRRLSKLRDILKDAGGMV